MFFASFRADPEPGSRGRRQPTLKNLLLLTTDYRIPNLLVLRYTVNMHMG